MLNSLIIPLAILTYIVIRGASSLIAGVSILTFTPDTVRNTINYCITQYKWYKTKHKVSSDNEVIHFRTVGKRYSYNDVAENLIRQREAENKINKLRSNINQRELRISKLYEDIF